MTYVHPAYKIEGPALISFSGGRTSAFMLHEILRAHDGKLPDDVVVAFANTGKEREETLRFVHECGSRWGINIVWVEYRRDAPGFAEVGYNSASRAGEPFAALIESKQYLPKSVMRFCTTELKIRPMSKLCRTLGWANWTNVIGLRYDEGHRVLKAIDRSESGKDPWRNEMPMAKAKVTERDVRAFWREQDFDLGLESYEGNCDLCFLKTRGKLKRLIRDNPEMAQWWQAMEAKAGGQFRERDSYRDIEREVLSQPMFLDFDVGDDEHDAECGLTCAGE
jgi:3'-phosphoadenosine 5'-phosphosulfate sulfotransferase (PAPS reductase)/FAD synthetase